MKISQIQIPFFYDPALRKAVKHFDEVSKPIIELMGKVPDRDKPGRYSCPWCRAGFISRIYKRRLCPGCRRHFCPQLAEIYGRLPRFYKV